MTYNRQYFKDEKFLYLKYYPQYGGKMYVVETLRKGKNYSTARTFNILEKFIVNLDDENEDLIIMKIGKRLDDSPFYELFSDVFGCDYNFFIHSDILIRDEYFTKSKMSLIQAILEVVKQDFYLVPNDYS